MSVEENPKRTKDKIDVLNLSARTRRRNNLDIMADILRAARAGSKKTWIIYDTNLNFTVGKKYLSELTNHELLTVEEGSIIYKTTEKGLEFLEKYDSFRKYRPLEARARASS